MRNREFLAWCIVSLLFGFTITSIYTSIKKKDGMRKYETQHFKDSLEIEYYKKQLELYPFDHSKIPTDGK